MDDIPLSALFIALGILLAIGAFFSGAETALMAANRYRLKHAASSGHRGAKLTMALLAETDKLLGVILLGNTIANASATTLASLIAIHLFGEEKWVLGVSTLLVSFAILIGAELAPKVIGASYADRISLYAGYVLTPILRIANPVVWFVNLFVSGLLSLLRLKRSSLHETQPLSHEEMRSMVLEAGGFIPEKHRSILMNLFDLESITVEDVMTPRGSIEAINTDAPWHDIVAQLTTAYHTRLPIYRDDPNNVLGIVHLRRLLTPLQKGELTVESLIELAAPPYFIPASTPAYDQLTFFEDNRQRIGLVIDEYGEILGLITLEDIVEELIGKFTTSAPAERDSLQWDANGSVLVEGTRSLRELNRLLAITLPVNGPKTLNGLILEHFEDIPEAGISIKIAGIPIEVVQTQDRAVRIARLYKPST